MLKVLKAGAAIATATTVLAVSLLTGPAANAATHKVSAGNKHISTAVKVVGHTDKLYLDAASKKAVPVEFKHIGSSKTYMAAKYTVSLKHGKKVLYRATTTTYRALDAEVQVMLSSAKYKNDAAVKKVIKRTLALSEKAAKTELTKTLDTAVFETLGTYATMIVDVINDQVKQNPSATWEDLGITPEQMSPYDPETGVKLALTGTPQDYTLTITGKYTSAKLVYTSKTNTYQRTNWINYPGLDAAFKL
jgi:hypothetical protein